MTHLRPPASGRPLRLAGVMAVTALAVSASVLPAWGADESSGVDIVNTETVQIYTDADGKVKSKRLYEQLVLSGDGEVRLTNPVDKGGLRNLDGFGGFDVRSGLQHVETTVDGEKAMRAVSSYSGALPLKVGVTYLLDGKKVSAADVVGESGRLEVRYRVENVSAKPTEVSYPDGQGGTVTETVDVPVPMVGSLTVNTPPNYRNVSSGEANLAGDGKGGTKLSFTMTLFPPIGSTTAEFGYTADITDGVVPRADISALPVNPLDSPTFKTAASSYQGGADTGAQLAAGATEIDANLLKLRDGAADLLAGLIQLHDGAGQLNEGLSKAAPGAQKLSDGLGKARDGGKKLADGAGKLAAGLGDADSGAKKLQSGASELNAGQRSLAGGLKQLNDGLAALPAGLQTMIDKVGTLDSAPSTTNLLGAIKMLSYGVQMPAGTADCSSAGADAGRCGVLDGIDATIQTIQSSTATATAVGTALATTAGTVCAASTAPVACVDAFNGTTGLGAQLTGILTANRDSIVAGLQRIKSGATAPGKLTDGFTLLRSKISTGNVAACAAGGACGLLEGLMVAKGGAEKARAGIGSGAAGCDAKASLQCGANALLAGTGQIVDGTDQLVGGTKKLRDGGRALSAGAGDLNDGLGQLDDGARELAGGLGDAADGIGRLEDGLGEASAGAPQLVDGAERLSAEGTQKLAAAGVDTAQSYGQMAAVIQAGATRADEERMIYGAPEGAMGLTAYSFVLQGEDGAGARNLTRGLLAGGLLALGSGAVFLRRRFI
ncbi:MAG TPA: hypothetical protein VGE38_00575 [Nocardioides sp.]|uniref:hypothetical protein n=1 Tax=Nocardioides sp. TaxID=35761 RepID=UPI002ED8E0AA